MHEARLMTGAADADADIKAAETVAVPEGELTTDELLAKTLADAIDCEDREAAALLVEVEAES